MAEMRALDEPLSDTELDSLEGFLASDSVPQDCMDLEMLDGFLTAIVSGPESIQPSEWLPQVWSEDRKSTRLNSSHTVISYAVFCLKKKTKRHAARLAQGRLR